MKKILVVLAAVLLMHSMSCKKDSQVKSIDSLPSTAVDVAGETNRFLDFSFKKKNESLSTPITFAKAEQSYSEYVQKNSEKLKLYSLLINKLSNNFINPNGSVKNVLKSNLVNPNPGDPPTPVALFNDYMAQASTIPQEMHSTVSSTSYTYLDNLNSAFIAASQQSFALLNTTTTFTLQNVISIKRRYTNAITSVQSQVESNYSIATDEKTLLINSLIAVKAYINSAEFDSNFTNLLNAPMNVESTKNIGTNGLANSSLWSALASVGKAIATVMVVVSCVIFGVAAGSALNPVYGGIIGGISGYTVGGYLAEKWFGLGILPGGID